MNRLSWIVVAAFLMTGGAIHLDLWQNGYKVIPYIGPLFLANAVVSGLVAAGLLVRPNRVFGAAAALLATGSLGALVLSRTTGLLGFREAAWTTAAVGAVAAEVGALVALGLAMAVDAGRTPVLAAVPAVAGARRGR